MKKTNPQKLCVFAIALLLTTGLFAQSGFDGNGLPAFLGKTSTSSEFNDLTKNYHSEMANAARYLSKEGIELLLKNGTLTEINLYNKSAVYGSFTAKLPNNLRFGMSSGEVKNLLGKPIESYNNGYCEFEMPGYIISCWFEGGRLNQVGLASR